MMKGNQEDSVFLCVYSDFTMKLVELLQDNI